MTTKFYDFMTTKISFMVTKLSKFYDFMITKLYKTNNYIDNYLGIIIYQLIQL